MNHVYDYISDMEKVASEYFNFYYNKNIYSFEELYPTYKEEAGDRLDNIHDIVEEYNKAKGEWLGLNKRESEYRDRFFPLAEKYKDKTIPREECLLIIEQEMLRTDSIGRKAIARQIARKISTFSWIGFRGFNELSLLNPTPIEEDPCVYYPVEKDRLKFGENIDSELLDDVEEIREFIPEFADSFFWFIIEFKNLCNDFDIMFSEIADEFGYYALKDLSLAGWQKCRKIEKTASGQRNDFNYNRKRIAIEALLGTLGVKRGSSGNISAAKMYRFAHLLTGKGNKEQKTDTLPTREMFDKPKSKQKAREDNLFVAGYFRELRLDNIADEIEKGIYD